MSRLKSCAGAALGAIAVAFLGGSALAQAEPTPAQIDETLKAYVENVRKYDAQFAENAKVYLEHPDKGPTKDPKDFQGMWEAVLPISDPVDKELINGYRGAWRPISNTGLTRTLGLQLVPMTPLAKDIRDQRVAASQDGHPFPDSIAECKPFGMPRVMTNVQMVHVDYTPETIVFMWETAMARRFIHMDGKPAPADEPMSYMGYSRGRWDGATLIIDTDHIRGDTFLNSEGLSHSGKIKVHEEMTKVVDKYGGTFLRDQITIEDPDFFSRPFTAERIFLWHGIEEIIEYSCEENNRNPVVDGKVVAR